MNKKSQSAMEYLMTYGWAILVVLIALGALFYLGVFSPKTPNTCIAVAPITCTDVKIVDGATDVITVSVAATGTSSATLGTLTLTSPVSYSTVNWDNTQIPTSTPTARTAPSPAANIADLAKGNKFVGTIDVTYTPQGGVSHTTQVQFSGTVE